MHSTASLDKTAKILTVLGLVISIAVLYPILVRKGETGTLFSAIMGLFLFFVMAYSYYYSTKGYTLKDSKLIIHRPAGDKVISLKKLKGVYDFKKIEKGLTIRLFGNGGLFGYFGHFNNDKIGRFKMYSTKGWDFYILDFGKEKIAISPDEPEFIGAIKELIQKEDSAES